MKKFVLLVSIAVFIVRSAFSDPVMGDNLDIGYNNSPAFMADSGIIGSFNTGFGNINSSLISGIGHHVDANWTSGILVAGSGFYGQGLEIFDSAFIGSGNSAYAYITETEEYYPTQSSLMAGAFNGGTLQSGLIAGSFNYAAGQQFVLGRGLIADQWESLQVMVGRYNLSPTPDQLFVIGNGTSQVVNNQTQVTRSNALEIYTNGQIRMPTRQGDILMGEFGQSGD